MYYGASKALEKNKEKHDFFPFFVQRKNTSCSKTGQFRSWCFTEKETTNLTMTMTVLGSTLTARGLYSRTSSSRLQPVWQRVTCMASEELE